MYILRVQFILFYVSFMGRDGYDFSLLNFWHPKDEKFLSRRPSIFFFAVLNTSPVFMLNMTYLIMLYVIKWLLSYIFLIFILSQPQTRPEPVPGGRTCRCLHHTCVFMCFFNSVRWRILPTRQLHVHVLRLYDGQSFPNR